MNIIRISQDSLTEELSYRALAGDSIIKLNITGHNINKDNLVIPDIDVYLDIQTSAYL